MDENSDRALGPHWFHLVFNIMHIPNLTASLQNIHNYLNIKELSVVNIQNIFSKDKKILFWDPNFFFFI